MDILTVRIASALAIAAAYMLFDVFNRRNVPSVFVYATVAYGAVLTALYFDAVAIAASAAIALIIAGIGYVVYRAGQIGAADVAEMAALSLVIPTQPAPLLAPYIVQFGMPFAVSVMVGTGIAAMAVVPLYYIPKAMHSRRPMRIGRKNAAKALLIAAAYLAFAASLELTSSITLPGIAILGVLIAGSASIIAFEEPITLAMVKYVPVGGFEEGDIIAFNLMRRKDVSAARRRVRRFDRLVTRGLIKEMHAKGIRQKFPVYKEALPLALPIFIGVVASLLIGDLFMFVL